MLGVVVGGSAYYGEAGPNAGDLVDAGGAELDLGVPVLGIAADARARWQGLEARAVVASFSVGSTGRLRRVADEDGENNGFGVVGMVSEQGVADADQNPRDDFPTFTHGGGNRVGNNEYRDENGGTGLFSRAQAFTLGPPLPRRAVIQIEPEPIAIGSTDWARLEITLLDEEGYPASSDTLKVIAEKGSVREVLHKGSGKFGARYQPPAAGMGSEDRVNSKAEFF